MIREILCLFGFHKETIRSKMVRDDEIKIGVCEHCQAFLWAEPLDKSKKLILEFAIEEN